MAKFDYYLFLDYSEELIGHIIISGNKVDFILPRISKFKHYKELNNKLAYLHSIKKVINSNKLVELIYEVKILPLRKSIELFSRILSFLHQNSGKRIFMSIDNNQFKSFSMVVKEFINNKNLKIVKEGELRKDTPEHKMSLVIDTLLNIERRKND